MSKHDSEEATSHLVLYRLVGSPILCDAHRSAKILGALARMEHGPVSCTWFSRRTGLPPSAALALLDDICGQGCARRIEVPWADSGHEREEPVRSSWFDLFDMTGADLQRPAPIQRVYDFFRRTWR